MTTTIQIRYHRSSRTLETGSDESLTLEKLHLHAARLFPLGKHKVSLSYEDEDQDSITLSSDADLAEALRVFEDLGTLPVFQINPLKPERSAEAPYNTGFIPEKRLESQFMRRLFKMNQRDFSKVANASKDIIRCGWKKERLNSLIRSFCDEVDAIYNDNTQGNDRQRQTYSSQPESVSLSGFSVVEPLQNPETSYPGAAVTESFAPNHSQGSEFPETCLFEALSKPYTSEPNTETVINFSGVAGVIQPISIDLVNRGKSLDSTSFLVHIRRLSGVFGPVSVEDISKSTGLGRVVLNASGAIETGQIFTATFAVKCPSISGTAISQFRLETPEGLPLSNTFSVFLNVQPLEGKRGDGEQPHGTYPSVDALGGSTLFTRTSTEASPSASLDMKLQEPQLNQSMGFSMIEATATADEQEEDISTTISTQTTTSVVVAVHDAMAADGNLGPIEIKSDTHNSLSVPAMVESQNGNIAGGDSVLIAEEETPDKDMTVSELVGHLEKLRDLGYDDEEHNRELLEQYKDYHLVLQHLLQESLGQWTVVGSDGEDVDFYGEDEDGDEEGDE